MAIFSIKFTVSLSYNAARFWCIAAADEEKNVTKKKKKSLTLQKQNKILRPSPYSKLCQEHKTSSVFPDNQYHQLVSRKFSERHHLLHAHYLVNYLRGSTKWL